MVDPISPPVIQQVDRIEKSMNGVSSNMSKLCWFGGDERGRSSIARGRVIGERPTSFQTQGYSRRHHKGSEASLLLLEAGRKTPSKASFGEKACPEKDSQRVGVSCNN